MPDKSLELKPFFIELYYNNELLVAEVKPCCQEDNVFYYDVLIDANFHFSITPNTTNANATNGYSWRVALSNSDKKVDPELADIVGQHIQEHLMH